MPTYSSAIGSFVIGLSPIGYEAPPIPPGLPFTTTWTGTLQKAIPSYLFVQFNDDANLQAFVDSYNTLQQQYVNWFNAISLPVYTGPLIIGSLLDWVGQGIYGIERPTLPQGSNRVTGPLGTWALGRKPLAKRSIIESQDFYEVNDDYYKRVMTWALYKGDGKQFNIRWLKKRVLRFLLGVNGTDIAIGTTEDISVTQSGIATTITINNSSTYLAAPIFKAAIDAQVLELPFQFTYTVTLA